jgi:hypothetical protein
MRRASSNRSAFIPERKNTVNKQITPDHCYQVDDVTYMVVPAPGTREWDVMKNGRRHRTFTSLTAAKGWLEHVLQHPASDRRPA